MSAGISSAAHRVFVDTSAYFALLDSRDARHTTAQAISTRLIRDSWRLHTTNYVIAEAHALILARLGRTLAAAFLKEIDRSNELLVRVSEVDEQRAREIIYQYDDKEFSLTDATSFAVMERLHIPFAFAFDHHFTQFGVALISPSQEQ
jgi:uncharacterized protein